MAPRAVTPALVALVAWAVLPAPLDQTPRRSSAALVVLAATPGRPVTGRPGRRAQLAHRAAATVALAALEALAVRAAIAAPAVRAVRAPPAVVPLVDWVWPVPVARAVKAA